MNFSIVVLAAGQGKRMYSDVPKVLHALAGRPLLEHVCRAAARLSAERIYVVYGHGGERVREALRHLDVTWIEQTSQLGTGHAVAQALPSIDSRNGVLILYGDVPLITSDTLERLKDALAEGGIGLLTVDLDDPGGYGRIVRDRSGAVVRIVEHKDATPEEWQIREINTGMMAIPAAHLLRWIERLDDRNAQREYYLTDIIGMAVGEGIPIKTVAAGSVYEVMGINDREQLADLERYYQGLQAQHLMRSGVTLRDPARFDLRGEIEFGRDAVIDVNVILEGRVKLGDRVHIGPNSYLRDADLGDDVVVLPNCVLEECAIGKGARIGPFSRIRPETRLADHVHVGNFVEIKKSTVAAGSKINHLSYVGDAEVGRDVNVGAGTITCNYDGANKHKTVIGDGVFIGSDTQLVAPVRVGDGATIGAGTTLTQDAPPGALTLGRARQSTVEGWTRPRKKKTGEEK
ncbi:MAG: bifunctional UDP-N-acetylglucosamine diphosphorylase/glucosamine-1-phosphate N-acetyltransferase GlmU [Gammaproteobacteria bacterium]|nr:bifunctional UDP-N-acetylglucosamine diphosphorylase/glucosamine-1-phosphate N-acetyltransferase GlmU [Gammaproteobacteria bacterium]